MKSKVAIEDLIEGHVRSKVMDIESIEGYVGLIFVMPDWKVVIDIVVEGRTNRGKGTFHYFWGSRVSIVEYEEFRETDSIHNPYTNNRKGPPWPTFIKTNSVCT